jgi:hypothetical protein
MTDIMQGETYSHNNGRLHSKKYKLSFVIPLNYSGDILSLDHIFVINSNDTSINKSINCTMYFNKPTDLVLSNWINEAFDIGKYRLKEAGSFQPNKYISIKRYTGGPYVAHKIKYDVSGYGFGAIVEGFLENEGALRHFVDELLKSVRTPPPRCTENVVSSSSTISSPKNAQCGRCAGSGTVTCSSCNGYGYHTQSYSRTAWDGSVEYVNEQIPCSSCSGGQATCSRCGGSGRVNSYC